MRTPVVLLDVDGVLNALGRPDERVHPAWRSGSATAMGRQWPITWAPAVVDRIAGWVRDGRADVRWLTTWGHDANTSLRHLLGLPELPVAGTHNDAPPRGSTGGSGASLAGSTPSAPGTGPSLAGDTPSAPAPEGWWKADVVAALLESDPGRTLVWIDDELAQGSEFTRWALARGVLPVGPAPATGLTDDDLAAVEVVLGPERTQVSDPAGS